MSHSECWPRDLEDVLRRALHTAAQSVEPGADGLDRIRSRISARRPVPSGWNMADLAGRAGPSSSVLRNLLRVSIGPRAPLYAVVQRFRPRSDDIGWNRWLRPAAAVATGVFVVLAGSWAFTTLPQVIVSSAGDSSAPGAGGGPVPVASSSGSGAQGTGSQNPVMSPSYSSSATYPQRHDGNLSPPASATMPVSSTPPPSTLSPSPTSPTSPAPSASPTPPATCSPSAGPTQPGHSPPAHKPRCHHKGHHKRR
jgi:hypothetical protein